MERTRDATDQARAVARVARDGEPSEESGYRAGAGDARIYYHVVGAGPDTIVAVHGGPGAGMNAFFPDVVPIAAIDAFLGGRWPAGAVAADR